jgi:hypothetical protein
MQVRALSFRQTNLGDHMEKNETVDVPTSITVSKLEKFPFEEDHNPFHHDPQHMGMLIGSNTMLMYGNFDTAPMKYCIFVNTKTGERFRIDFDESWQ